MMSCRMPHPVQNFLKRRAFTLENPLFHPAKPGLQPAASGLTEKLEHGTIRASKIYQKEVRALAQIKPFRALRYQLEKAGRIEELTCPPYDIISETQRQAYLERNPYNVIRLELPRGDSPYEEAGKTLEEWLQEGILKRYGGGPVPL